MGIVVYNYRGTEPFVFIACYGDHTIKRWIKSSNNLMTIAGTGTAGDSSDYDNNLRAHQKALNGPSDIAIVDLISMNRDYSPASDAGRQAWGNSPEPAGQIKLYIVDSGNKKIRFLGRQAYSTGGTSYAMETWTTTEAGSQISTLSDPFIPNDLIRWNYNFVDPRYIGTDPLSKILFISDNTPDNEKNVIRKGRGMCDPITGE
jgi:hypothetical protein